MKLTDEEEARCAPASSARRRNGRSSIRSRSGAISARADFVPVSQAHIMADTESLGAAGVEWLERMARLPPEQRRVRIPTITDPRGTDFAAAHRLKQQPWMLDLERRAIAAFEALGVLMTEHLHQLPDHHAAGARRARRLWRHRRRDLFATACAARARISRAGPRRLSAGLTGRTPRYGYHLDERRQRHAR